MIRIIDLTGQITDDADLCFAFYDTVSSTFCSFSGNQDWDSLEDFLEDFEPTESYTEKRFADKIHSLIAVQTESLDVYPKNTVLKLNERK